MSTLARAGLVTAGFALGALAATLYLRRPSPAPSATPAALPVVRDPLRFVPPGVRLAARVDLAALRGAGLLGTLVGSDRESCTSRLASQLDAAVLVSDDEQLRSVGLAFVGRVSRDDLLACARQQTHDEGAVRSAVWRGVPLSRLERPRAEGLAPTDEAPTIAWLPGGVVLVGDRVMVRRMLDQALVGSDDEPSVALAHLRRRLDAAGATVELLYNRGSARGGDDPGALLPPAVRSVGATVRTGTSLSVRAVFACDDFDSPRALVQSLDTLRALASTSLPALAPVLAPMRFERTASEVQAELTLDAEGIGALFRWARPMLRDGSLVLGSGALAPEPDAGARDR